MTGRAFLPFRDAAAGRLRSEPATFAEPRADLKGDHAFDPGALAGTVLPPPRPAAVLVPVVTRPDEPTLILTQRAAHLRSHSGQIAFPGGRVDPEDLSPVHAALREAEEEIGLDRRWVEPLGYLDAYLSGTNFFVMPVVAAVDPGFTLSVNPDEVAEAFEVPLAFLMDEANHAIHSREWKGAMRRYYAIPFADRYIWGVTAGILRNMYERLYAR